MPDLSSSVTLMSGASTCGGRLRSDASCHPFTHRSRMPAPLHSILNMGNVIHPAEDSCPLLMSILRTTMMPWHVNSASIEEQYSPQQRTSCYYTGSDVPLNASQRGIMFPATNGYISTLQRCQKKATGSFAPAWALQLIPDSFTCCQETVRCSRWRGDNKRTAANSHHSIRQLRADGTC